MASELSKSSEDVVLFKEDSIEEHTNHLETPANWLRLSSQILAGGDDSYFPTDEERMMTSLHELFPALSKSEIQEAITQCSTDMDAAINMLLERTKPNTNLELDIPCNSDWQNVELDFTDDEDESEREDSKEEEEEEAVEVDLATTLKEASEYAKKRSDEDVELDEELLSLFNSTFQNDIKDNNNSNNILAKSIPPSELNEINPFDLEIGIEQTMNMLDERTNITVEQGQKDEANNKKEGEGEREEEEEASEAIKLAQAANHQLAQEATADFSKYTATALAEQKRVKKHGYDPKPQRDYLTKSKGGMNLFHVAKHFGKACYIEKVLSQKLANRFEKKWASLKKMYGKNHKYAQPRLAFHGTTSTSADGIKATGFLIPGKDEGAYRANGAAYGVGVYVSPSLRFASSYAYGGDGKVLVLSVLPGRRTHRSSQYTGTKKSWLGFGKTKTVSYNSCRANSKIWVMFESSQVLPLYIIHRNYPM